MELKASVFLVNLFSLSIERHSVNVRIELGNTSSASFREWGYDLCTYCRQCVAYTDIKN